jgi:hypothetical protein
MIRVRFSLTWKEYYDAYRFLLRGQRVPVDKIFGGALLLLGAALYLMERDLFYWLGACALGLALLCVPPLRRRLEFKRKWSREPLHQAEHIVAFEEEGISYVQGPVASRLDWNYYQRMIESREGFLLVYGDEIFSLIPKRAFADEQTMAQFRALTATKLSGQ